MKFALALLGTLVLAAPRPSLAAPRVDADGHLIRDAHSCGTTRTPSPVAYVAPFAAPTRRTVFLNGKGGMYNISSSATNAATNTANRIASGDGRAYMNAIIPPVDASFNWPYVVECVKKQFKPYSIIVTESEPATGPYIEAVGGSGSTTGWGPNSGILGVAAADNFCGVTETGIAFTFSSNHVGITKANDELCATIAHEIGHLLALEHEVSGVDTMSYVPFFRVNQKSFTDANSECGTDAQNVGQCSCQTTGAGEVTSSGKRLAQYVGMRPTETVPPKLEVTAPGNDDTLRPSFTVTATASDETEMGEVTVLVDGVVAGSSTAPAGSTYSVKLNNVTEGNHMLEVQAIDFAGNIAKKQLAVNVALGKPGDTCGGAGDCKGNICASDAEGASFCTQACSDANKCPDDFSCDPVGDQQICVPSSGGGCSVGGGYGWLSGLVVGLGLVLGRRKRRG